MSSIAYYTFYLESEQGVAVVDGTTPSINSIKLIPGGAAQNVEAVQGTLQALGDGLFQYSVDWSNYNNNESLFVKIDTGLEAQDQKYLTTRLERHDILPNLVDNIQTSANSLVASSTTLAESVQKIVDIEEGSWVIEGNQFKIFNKDADLSADGATPIATFDLFDGTGIPNGESPTKRIATEG